MSLLENFSHVLFDFDGTIMDTSEGIYNAFDYVCDHYGMERKGKDFYSRLIGPPLLDSFRTAFKFSPGQCEDALKVYREYYTPKGLYEVKVYDGIPLLLENLKRAGKILAVASSKPECFVNELLERFGLSGYFDFAGGSDLEETRVKKCDVIEYVLGNLGVKDKAVCVMAGDRKFDVQGALEAGISCIGVLWGFGSREELSAAGALFTVSTPQELCVI